MIGGPYIPKFGQTNCWSNGYKEKSRYVCCHCGFGCTILPPRTGSRSRIPRISEKVQRSCKVSHFRNIFFMKWVDGHGSQLVSIWNVALAFFLQWILKFFNFFHFLKIDMWSSIWDVQRQIWKYLKRMPWRDFSKFVASIKIHRKFWMH